MGFSFLFNLLNIMNLAHGAIYMVSAYIAFGFTEFLGLSPWIGLVAAAITLFILGFVVERTLFRPFVGDFDRIIVVCIAIATVLQTTTNILLGDRILALPRFANGVIKLGVTSVSMNRVVVFIMSGVLLGMVLGFVRWSRWGLQMRAIAEDREGAALQGINIQAVSGVACAVAFGLAAIAGCLMGSYLNIGPFMGDFILIKVLIVVILAGIGSVSGIIYTSFALAVIDSILPLFVNGAASQAIAIGIVIALLWVRPRGFFGYES